MSYGRLLPGTALFAPIEWLLQVKLLAHWAPFGKVTPHCLSTSTGPFGFGTFGFCSSFLFFFFFGSLSLSSSASALRFLPFFVPSSAPAPFAALFLAPVPLLPSLTSSSSSSSSSLLPAFSFARWAASRASFFLRAFSCFDFRHPVKCSFAVRLSTGR